MSTFGWWVPSVATGFVVVVVVVKPVRQEQAIVKP
jgi:hypothetical protein